MRAALAHTLGVAGNKKEAILILDDLNQLATQKYVAPYFIAGIHIGLGENERAMECLEKSHQERSTGYSISTPIPAWMPCGTMRIFKTCCNGLAFRYGRLSHLTVPGSTHAAHSPIIRSLQ